MTHRSSLSADGMTASPRGGRTVRPGQWLVVVTIATMSLLATLGAVIAWRGYQNERQRVREHAALLAAASASDAERLLNEQIATLGAVAASRVVRSGEAAPTRDYLLRVRATNPLLTELSLVNRAGAVIATTASGPPAGTVVTDRATSEQVQRSGVPFVGAVKVDSAGGPGFAIGVPALNAEDQPAGAVMAVISAARLSEQLTRLAAEHSARLVVLDRAGLVLAGGPPGAPASAALRQRVQVSDAGVAADVAGVLGERGQLVAWASVPAGGWTLLIEQPVDSAFGPPRRSLLGTLAALVGAVCVGLTGAVWAGRRLDRDAAARRAAEPEVVRLLERERVARTEAEQALKLRDEVVATLSHDLRSPLSTIKGYAQLLRRQLKGADERAVGGLERIDAACDRMGALFNEVVDTARLQSGQPLELIRHQYDLVAQVQQAVEDLRHTVSSHTFQVEATPPAITGNWDGPRIGRVLDNLLSNAIKYSPNGGTVTVGVAQTDGRVTLRVTDEGLGIPAAELSRITERFFRASNVQGTINGTGIGLAGVRQIIEQHGGSVAITSIEGHGATVTVTLPVDSEAQQAVAG